MVGVPSGYVNSLLLNMAIDFVSFPINSMVDLSIVMLVYQRVSFPKNSPSIFTDV